MLSRLGFGKKASISMRTLSAAQFRSELEQSKDKLLIDVREPEEYKSGFIVGAKNIPLSQLEQRLSVIPKDREVLLYCRSGMRSKTAARNLQKHGYTRIAHLRGGISSLEEKLARR